MAACNYIDGELILTAACGEQFTLNLNINRTGNCTGPITFTPTLMPPGVNMPIAVIPAGENSLSMQVTVSPSASSGPFQLTYTSSGCGAPAIFPGLITLTDCPDPCDSVSVDISIDQNVQFGEAATFTVSVNNAVGTLTYQWQEDTTGTCSVWSALTNVAPYSGTNTVTLTIDPCTLDLTNHNYRCVVTDSVCGPQNSGCGTITVGCTPDPFNTFFTIDGVYYDGSNLNWLAGSTHNIVLVVVDCCTFDCTQYELSPTPNILNQYMDLFIPGCDGTGFAGTIQVAADAPITGLPVAVPINIITENCGTIVRNLNIVYQSSCIPVAITIQPINENHVEGEAATFTVTPSGTAPFAYQWQVNRGAGWVNISNGPEGSCVGPVYTNATASNMGITGTTTCMNGFLYRCLVSNCSGVSSAISNSALLTVTECINIPVVTPNPITINAGETIAVTITNTSCCGLTSNLVLSGTATGISAANIVYGSPNISFDLVASNTATAGTVLASFDSVICGAATNINLNATVVPCNPNLASLTPAPLGTISLGEGETLLVTYTYAPVDCCPGNITSIAVSDANDAACGTTTSLTVGGPFIQIPGGNGNIRLVSITGLQFVVEFEGQDYSDLDNFSFSFQIVNASCPACLPSSNSFEYVPCQPVTSVTIATITSSPKPLGNITYTNASDGTGTKTYQWQVDKGGGFVNIPAGVSPINADGGTFLNGTGTVLDLQNMPPTASGYIIRLQVSNDCSGVVTNSTSNNLTLNFGCGTDCQGGFNAPVSSSLTSCVVLDTVTRVTVEVNSILIVDQVGVGNTTAPFSALPLAGSITATISNAYYAFVSTTGNFGVVTPVGTMDITYYNGASVLATCSRSITSD